MEYLNYPKNLYYSLTTKQRNMFLLGLFFALVVVVAQVYKYMTAEGFLGNQEGAVQGDKPKPKPKFDKLKKLKMKLPKFNVPKLF